MSNMREFHQRAMEHADAAFAARRAGDAERAREYFELAFIEESKAANIASWQDMEPTRSVLHRSAATLGLECGSFAGAKRLALEGLRGHPPREIEQELQEVLHRIEQAPGADRLAATRYSLPIDGRWTMPDLSEFMRLYERVYFFEMLVPRPEWVRGTGEPAHVYPLRGGFSYVNFYEHLPRMAPAEACIEIYSIQYSSPGWIGLRLYAPAALEVGLKAAHIRSSGLALQQKYGEIHGWLSSQRLLSDGADDDVVAQRGLGRDVARYWKDLSCAMDMDQGRYRDGLLRLAGGKLKALKLLLSYFRRLRHLNEYVDREMIKL